MAQAEICVIAAEQLGSVGVTDEIVTVPYVVKAIGAPVPAGDATLLAISAQGAKGVVKEADAKVSLYYGSALKPVTQSLVPFAFTVPTLWSAERWIIQ